MDRNLVSKDTIRHVISAVVLCALLLSFAVALPAYAQDAMSTTTGTATTTPGVPVTGYGGGAMTNLVLLGISAAIMIGAAVYLVRKSA